jgi:hypothetical protein
MRKLLLSAVAAGALAMGGAASAQDILGGLGAVLPQILNSIVLGGTDGSPGTVVQGGQTTVDQWGRQVYTDPYGRQIVLNSDGTYTDIHGNPVYVQGPTRTRPPSLMGLGPRVYDQYGRRIILSEGSSVEGNVAGIMVDRDGDGVADVYDRYPNDRRYR